MLGKHKLIVLVMRRKELVNMLDRVVVINDDSMETGGAATIAIASVRLLRRQGVPVTVLTGDSDVNPELEQLGAEVFSLQGRHILKGSRSSAALRGLYSAKTRRLLDGWIDRHDTAGTVYHLHNWHKILSASVFLPLRRVADRLVLSTHDFFLVCPNGGYFNFAAARPCELAPMGMRCLLSQCDKRHYGHKLWRMARQSVRQNLFDFRNTNATVLAVHEGMIPLLERGGIPRKSMRVLRNPVTPWRTERVSAERNRDIVYVGRLEHDKGIDVLANAARRSSVRIRCVGDGPLKDTLANRPEIELLGRLSREQIGCLVAGARLVIVPSLVRETFGLVVLEALMSGIPVIVSEYALIAQEVVRLGLGVAFRPDDELDLVCAIRRMMEDDAAVGAMSRRAFAEASKLTLTPEAWCGELLRTYRAKLSASDGASRASAGATPILTA